VLKKNVTLSPKIPIAQRLKVATLVPVAYATEDHVQLECLANKIVLACQTYAQKICHAQISMTFVFLDNAKKLNAV
jgi:hypothetical protein